MANIRTSHPTSNRQRQAAVYHDLGIIAQEQRRYDEAETNYRQALDIYQEYGDQHSAADTYSQLNTLAHRRER